MGGLQRGGSYAIIQIQTNVRKMVVARTEDEKMNYKELIWQLLEKINNDTVLRRVWRILTKYNDKQ